MECKEIAVEDLSDTQNTNKWKRIIEHVQHNLTNRKNQNKHEKR